MAYPIHDRSYSILAYIEQKNMLPVMVEPLHPIHPTTFLTVESNRVQTLVSTYPLL